MKLHEIVAVVTQPDKPAGRGRKLTPPPVKEFALENNLKVLQPASVKTREFADEFAALNPDIAVVVAYGKILPQHVLDVPRHGCLNVHASLLPKFRGAAPIQWAIIRGETETGVTIMQMDAGMDTGPMIAKRKIEILEDDDATSLANVLAFMGAEAMEEVLTRLQEDGDLPKEPQDESKATKAPMISREMARIDWSKDYESIIFAIRGFQPWPKAFTTVGKTELKITGADAVDPGWLPNTAFDERVVPGTIVDVFKGRGFVVRTGGEHGALLVTRVQPQGKPEMGAYDYANGGAAEVGSILGAVEE